MKRTIFTPSVAPILSLSVRSAQRARFRLLLAGKIFKRLRLAFKGILVSSAIGFSFVLLGGDQVMIQYEGDTLPTQSSPAWAIHRTEGLINADVSVDVEADGGSALELETGGGSGNFALVGQPLSAFDNLLGWRLHLRHKAIENSGESIVRFRQNDDSDHLRIFDGVLGVAIDFRPGQVRVHSTPASENVGNFCQDFPQACRLRNVPEDQYIEVNLVAAGGSFTVRVNEFAPWSGVTINTGNSGDPFLGFGNFSGSGRLSSLARWDFVRLDMRGAAPVFACSGFQSPFDAGPVTVRKNRALPLKAELFDEEGLALSDLDIMALPVLQVLFDPAGGGDAIDVTDEAFPAGEGTNGNQFVFSDGLWRFNLKTKNYSAAGTYAMTMVSGDEAEYFVEGCSAQFVIDP